MDGTPRSETSYDAFITYRRSDGRSAANRLRRRLQAFRLPKGLRGGRKRKLTVFLDTAYERGAADFYDETIRPALIASRWLIVVATPDAVRRPKGEDWIAREVADFSAGPNGRNIVVVRALGEFIDRLPADIAERLPNVQIVDLRNDTALARLSPQTNARLADETLKIVGPLFGVPLDDMPRLRREEERRQMARLGAAAGVSVAAVAMTVGLSLYALRSQVEGQRALAESLRATQSTIDQLASLYGEEEPADSPLRQLVLNYCDAAARVSTLSGTPRAEPTRMICRTEVGLAMASSGNTGEGLKLIRDAAEASAKAAAKSDETEADFTRAARTAWSTLVVATSGTARDEAEAGHAAFEEGRARRIESRTAPGQDKPGSDPRKDAAEAWRLAAQVHGRIAERAAKEGRAELTVRAARAAAANLGRALDALGPRKETAALWYAIAEDDLDRRLAFARARRETSAAEARESLDKALSVLASAPAAGAAEANFVRGYRSLLMRERLIGSGMSVEETEKAAWACIEEAHPLASAEEESLGKAQADEALSGCIDDLAEMTDMRRAEIDKSAAAGKLAAAAAELRATIAMSKRLETFRVNRGPWDHLYHFVALRDLAAYLEKLGRGEEAEAVRLEARDIYRPYLKGIDIDDLSASRAALARTAWTDIWNGHHAWIDRMRAEAAKLPMPASAQRLDKLLAADDAWDRAMPEVTAWDDAYQAEVLVELAALRASAGDGRGQGAALARACARLSKYAGSFPLEGNLLQAATSTWQALGRCNGVAAP